MSFGFSVSDFKAAWTLATFLHEKCFTKAFGADVQYLRFGREIESFAENLQQLVAVTEHANRQRPRRPWGNHNDECRHALQPLSQAVGDFQATLKGCEKLLNDHNRFQRNAAGFVDNVQWHMGTQRDVDILRERVQFHSTKLLVLMKPFELHLLLEIRQELQELRREVAELRGLLVTVLSDGNLTNGPDSRDLNVTFCDIPAEIESRFLEATQNPGPISISHETDMPLSEGFDALVYQFARSTVEFNPGLDQSQKIPDEIQFVNLLKSNWIMGKLENSVHLQELGPQSLWASYLRELKVDIVREYRRFHTNQLIAPSKDILVRLPDQCFSIWASAAPPIRLPDLAEQRPFEDLILELELPDSSTSRKVVLNVFRRSAIDFRFVTTSTDSNNPGYHQEKDFIVNTNAMKVIPAYAAPDSAANTNNLLLSSSHVQDLRWQYLSSAEEVAVLQQALTGYRVHHCMPNVSWSLNGSSKTGKCGKGKLQLWQPQALPSLNEHGNINATTGSNPSMNSPTSVASPASPKQSTAATTSTTLFSGKTATSTITGSRGNGTAVLMPELPVMILFTSYEGKYAFIYLELDSLTFVNPETCDCRKTSKKLCRVVILEHKSKLIKIRRLQSAQKGLDTWDLALFRTPRHPDFATVEEVSKVKYLRLDFPSVEEKDQFREELTSLEKVRSLDLKIYHNIINEKRHKDQKPVKRSVFPTKLLSAVFQEATRHCH